MCRIVTGLAVVWGALGALALAGCGEGTLASGPPDLVWGRRGIGEGRLQKPRAFCIDTEDRLYVVDMTARIQVFDADGNFLRQWQTPVHENGRPTGISIDGQGRVVVADTHYFRLLFYSPTGELLKIVGGVNGQGPGEFGWVTDVAQDSQGNYFVSEYGEWDRIQKLSPDGEYLLEWGGHGSEQGEFGRPQSLAIDKQDRVWVADACNHRIQVFDAQGKFLFSWGTKGTGPGELSYPYSIVFDPEGNLLVCEYGNHRVQKLTRDGESLGCWGLEGRQPGELFNPWAVVCDSRGRIHVLDTNNHRVQRIEL